MARLGPYEPRPALAIAVSGGRDSMALALLARTWVAGLGGSLTALVVDHGLRLESAADARQTANWLRELSIDTRILRWTGSKPASGMQAEARNARYRLLCAWCRRHGVLHLLTAHHGDDQAETVAMREARHGGGWGSAGMTSARIEQGVRLLRPLLGQPRHRVEAVVALAGQPWLDDPSNQDRRYERVRVRQALANEHRNGMPATLRQRASDAGRNRARLERMLARHAAECLSLSPAGFAVIDGPRWRAAAPEASEALLRQTLRCIGGGEFPPSTAKSAALAERLRRGDGTCRRTLAGCRIVERGDAILIAREFGRLPPPVPVRRGVRTRWDRYQLTLLGARPAADLRVGALGADGLRIVRQQVAIALPRDAAIVLPALRLGESLLSVPHLNHPNHHLTGQIRLLAEFSPSEPLLGDDLRVA